MKKKEDVRSKLEDVLNSLGFSDLQVSAKLEPGDRLTAEVTTPDFDEMEDSERQSRVWRAVQDQLDKEEQILINLILTNTPTEEKEALLNSNSEKFDFYIYGWEPGAKKWHVCTWSGGNSSVVKTEGYQEHAIVKNMKNHKQTYAAACLDGTQMKCVGAKFTLYPANGKDVLRGSKNDKDWDNKNQMKKNMPVRPDGRPDYSFGVDCGCE